MLRLASALAALALTLAPAVAAQPLDDPANVPCDGCAAPVDPDAPVPDDAVTPAEDDADEDTDEAFEEDHLWQEKPQL